MLSNPDPRQATNPLFNDNKFKLGTFATNVSNGCAITTIDGVFETTWPNVMKLAKIADEAGIEAIVPVARWRGFGGTTNFNGTCFETYTWAAALGAITKNATIFATSHVPTVHPIMAAKQATTIDHITGGRFALNIVCGWYQAEMEMFGAPIMEHEQRYKYATEWLYILKRLWTEDSEWELEGDFFNIKRAFHQPKPLQKPYPALMNAGGSTTGRHYMAKNCDMALILITGHDLDTTRREISAYRDLAKYEYGRDIQIWTNCYCVIGDTEKDAYDFLDYYVNEKGDWAAVDNLAINLGVQTEMLPKEAVQSFKFHFAAGWGGYPLVGTAEQIADKIETLSRLGLDGTLMNWPRYEEGLCRFVAKVMPLLEYKGLRQPFRQP
ncbi:MAG: LLM class flavin-dependent oxidoreductase [Stigonema ocellatum SAG 48.90 = DSM 106950]|nr:LLM class flavin-dependent oxidoreductase [Stigonema ocellatum SAG 48.90 = DSM 106950]